MTKHEYHIALVLLALITAGVLGYQMLNTETHRGNGDCTLALYFSGPNGCNNKPQVQSISGSAFAKRIEDYFSPEKRSHYDISMETSPFAQKKTSEGPIENPKSKRSSEFDALPVIKCTDQHRALDDTTFLIFENHERYLRSVLKRIH
ncbi:hypothetical protein [Rhodohalobacter sp. 8-1]|uniref:hypothetical protein n=1 Tax=Rhodohalobacter sp. 8-1 TaxID=3131972 RepID=UPI0030ED51C4